uniref:Uncharacterized protein n=1 Tax=Anguilla anguilla TaxID=7936 RepID=A0A0E9VY83_ANGAN
MGATILLLFSNIS